LPSSCTCFGSRSRARRDGIGVWISASPERIGSLMFDHPMNALSVARRHQQELLHKEQMDHLARQVDPGTRPIPDGFVTVIHWLALLSAPVRGFLKKRARRSTVSSRRYPAYGSSAASQRSLMPGEE
jgi:hypothetical protein